MIVALPFHSVKRVVASGICDNALESVAGSRGSSAGEGRISGMVGLEEENVEG